MISKLIKNLKLSYKVNILDRNIKYIGFAHLLFNYLANILISFFLYFRIKPNSITYLNFVLSLLAIYFIFLFDEKTIQIAIMLHFFNILLDKCDGGLARVYKNKTFYGKYLDGITDTLTLAIFYFGLMINLIIDNLSAFNISICGLAIIFFLMNTCILDRYSAITRWCNLENKKKILPYLPKTNNFHKFKFFLELDGVFIILFLILITPDIIPNIQYINIYFFYLLSIIFIYIGFINMFFHTLYARKNLDFPKK